ncbi:type II secretion system protein [Poriferisphaera sp. WC338]|uniref:type II secretion system protein n=1 Tax=Poriferisphaera sp. WC338 TaxID=3425129 RepID=UPI003D812D68
MKRKFAYCQDGFTLIELVATVVIAAVLLATVIQVISSLGRTSQIITQRTKQSLLDPPWQRRIKAQFKRDFDHATSVDILRDRIELQTLCEIDPFDHERRYIPVRVVYQAIGRSEPRILVRRQYTHPQIQRSKPNVDLIAIDVVQFDVSRLELEQLVQPDEQPSEVEIKHQLPYAIKLYCRDQEALEFELYAQMQIEGAS